LTSQIIAAAIHEAGHVVARLVHGAGFERAFIRPDGTGLTEFIPKPGADPFEGAIRALAGPIAEAIFSGQPLGQILSDQAQVDRAHARAALAAARRNMGDAVDDAAALLSRCWPAVVAIAAVLEADGEIFHERAATIIGRRCFREDVGDGVAA